MHKTAPKHAHSILRLLVQVPQESSLQPNWSMRKVPFFKYGLNKIDPNKVKVTLIEAADRILPALSTKMANHTHTQLEKLGVEVLTHHRVAKVR